MATIKCLTNCGGNVGRIDTGKIEWGIEVDLRAAIDLMGRMASSFVIRKYGLLNHLKTI